jgi:hypothetical protein
MKKIALIVAISMIVLVGTVGAYEAISGVQVSNIETANFVFGGSEGSVGEGFFGASGDSNFTNIVAEDITATDDLVVGDDVTVGGDVAVTGNTALTGTLAVTGQTALSGSFTYLEKIDATVVAAKTLLPAESGTTFYLASSTGLTFTLPPVASSTGVFYRFVIKAAFATTNYVIDSAEGDNIEGTLIVAGAVVDCDAEDQIDFVNDGENLGDYVEIRSDGTKWFIGDSGALTASKLTCTDPS